MSDPFVPLEREVDLLDRRVRAWSVRAWAVPLRPDVTTRADAVAALASRLDTLGRQAGVPVPAETTLPRVADHALADQVIVLATDLLAALRRAPEHRQAGELARQAAEAIRATRQSLAR